MIDGTIQKHRNLPNNATVSSYSDLLFWFRRSRRGGYSQLLCRFIHVQFGVLVYIIFLSCNSCKLGILISLQKIRFSKKLSFECAEQT